MSEPSPKSPFEADDVLVDLPTPPAPAVAPVPQPDEETTVDAAGDQETSDETPAAPTKPPTIGELRRERKQLWDEREDTVYHVGGLAVDLRRRGIDDLDLVNRRADHVLTIDARLNEVDATLEEIDTRRRGSRPVPAAGYCLSCGAPYQVEAAFCFRCGARVALPDEEPEMAPSPTTDTPTAVIDAGQYRTQ